jgi:hypothetical protein
LYRYASGLTRVAAFALHLEGVSQLEPADKPYLSLVFAWLGMRQGPSTTAAVVASGEAAAAAAGGGGGGSTQSSGSEASPMSTTRPSWA